MASPSSNVIHTEEEQSDSWVLVQGPSHHEETGPQVEDCNISPTQKPVSIIDDEAISDVACKPTHTKCCPPTIGVMLHSIKSSDVNPTLDPRVESSDSTATGLTFSALEDVSSDLQLFTPTEDNCQPQPLTRANLGPNNWPGLIRDIPAWINGDLQWLRVAKGYEQASDLRFERGTTCHSSDGSLDFAFVPAQPSSFGRDALAIGAVFEYLPHTQLCGWDIELDGVLNFPPGKSY